MTSAPTALEQALALHHEGDLARATMLYQDLLASAPEQPRVLILLGAARLQQRRVAESVTLLERAVAHLPDALEAHNNLSAALLAVPDARRAAHHALRAVELGPSSPEAHLNLGLARGALGQPAEGLESVNQAIALRPDDPRNHQERGTLLLALGDDLGALSAFLAALGCNPEHLPAHRSLANWYCVHGDADRAQRHAREALARAPEVLEDAVLALEADLGVCDWSRAVDANALALAVTTHPWPLSSFVFLSLPVTPAALAAVARVEGGHLARVAAAHEGWQTGIMRTVSTARLRVGYLTADIRNHPTAHLTRRLFALHDRARFEVTLYHTGPDDQSDYRRDIERGVERFVDAQGADDLTLARRIAEDGLDLLIDLQGYTAMQRMGVLALRPAPVQAHYLAYPSTLGAPFVDYFIADEVSLPPSLAAHFTERIARMPGCYQVNDDQAPICEDVYARSRCALPDEGVVYACFCSPFKIDQGAWAAWMTVLRAVPQGVLWLLASSHAMVRNLRAEAERHGVSPHRLVFATRLPKDRHLARLRCVDLALDTFHYGAHTTGSDALWAGVPLLTVAGETFASRVGLSMLTAQGLHGLCVPDREAYVALAIAFGRDPALRAQWRARVESARLQGALFNTAQTVRHLEALYEQMIRRQREGLSPADLSVP